jgi:hypothetical protein
MANEVDVQLEIVEVSVALEIPDTEIELELAGIRGPEGPQGPPGDAGTDSHFSLDFTNKSVVEVNHNLNKRPAVSVIDSAGDEVYGYVTYNDSNNLTVRFNNSFTGTILCN